jgi:hypothetical protein
MSKKIKYNNPKTQIAYLVDKRDSWYDYASDYLS